MQKYWEKKKMNEKDFLMQKKIALSRADKSSIGEWDEKIIPLCNKINSSQKYYTLSSCSGRIVLMIDQDKKDKGLFKFTTHSTLSLKKLNKVIEKITLSGKKENIKLKTEPPILHVGCSSLPEAKKLILAANISGFKKTGLISLGKKIVLEISSGEKIELPIVREGKLLANQEHIKIILEDSNKKLKISWEKIKRLEKNLSQITAS